MTLKQQFNQKNRKKKYQVVDETGKILCECRSETTALNMKKEFQLNKNDKLEVRKV